MSDSTSHFILSAVVTAGPSQDSPQFGPAVRHAAALLSLGCVLGDAGYDGEHNHRLCREVLGIASTVSRFKRRLSAALTARQPTTQTQAILLRALTHHLLRP